MGPNLESARSGLRWIVMAWLAMGALGLVRWVFLSYLEIQVVSWLPSMSYTWFEATEELVFRLMDVGLEAVVVLGVLKLRALQSPAAEEGSPASRLLVPLAIVLVLRDVLIVVWSAADFNEMVRDAELPAALSVALGSAVAVLGVTESALFARWSTRVARSLGRPAGWLGIVAVSFSVLHVVAQNIKPWLRAALGRQAPVGFIALPFGFVAMGALMWLLLRILDATREPTPA